MGGSMGRYLSPDNIYMQLIHMRQLKTRCRILPAGGMGGGVPQLYKPPNIGGYRGLIESISSVLQIIRR
jgi:hypothetical protein